MNNQLVKLKQNITQPLPAQTKSSAEKHPIIYLGFLALFAALGYGWLWFFPLATFVLTIYIPLELYFASNALHYMLAIAATLLAALCGWMSYDLLRLQISQPAGRPLTAYEAPQLRLLLDGLSKKYHLPQITRVRIVPEYTIEMVRIPACGLPYSHDVYLLIGLPLMQSLSARQLLAAIEREVVHLSDLYQQPVAWLYFSRQTFNHYQSIWQRKWTVSGLVLRSFFSWYAPLYRLLSQSACCQQQFFADKTVQSSISGLTLIDMLITSNISAHYLRENYWPHLYSKAYRHKHPPYLPYTSMDHNLRAKLDPEQTLAWLNTELQKTTPEANMPTLSQRLYRLGVQHAVLPPQVNVSAARYFLGENLKNIAGQLDQVWLKAHEFEWQQKFQQGLQEQKRLRSLVMQAMQTLLNDETAWELLQLSKRYMGSEQVLPLCKQILQNRLRDARIYFDIGRTLLRLKDVDGVIALEQAIKLDNSYTIIACQIITKYFVHTGNNKSAQNYRRRALAFQVDAA